MDDLLKDLGAKVLAAGALGTAAFGIVEGLKWFRAIGEAGFATLERVLGAQLVALLAAAYGSDVRLMLRGQYRGDSRELARIVRQGVRVGLQPESAPAAAAFLGTVNPDLLRRAAEQIDAGAELPAELRNVLGRFELAVDARIEAALAAALDAYGRTARFTAYVIALLIGTLVGFAYDIPLAGALVGLAAVPLAPIAKDVASAIKAAADAVRSRA